VEEQAWIEERSGLSKWELRGEIRRLRGEGCGPTNTLIERELTDA
jgi:hypothetical protein